MYDILDLVNVAHHRLVLHVASCVLSCEMNLSFSLENYTIYWSLIIWRANISEILLCYKQFNLKLKAHAKPKHASVERQFCLVFSFSLRVLMIDIFF